MFQLQCLLVQGTAASAKAKRICPGCGVQLPAVKKESAKDNPLCKHCVKVRKLFLLVNSVYALFMALSYNSTDLPLITW